MIAISYSQFDSMRVSLWPAYLCLACKAFQLPNANDDIFPCCKHHWMIRWEELLKEIADGHVVVIADTGLMMSKAKII